MAVMLKMMRAKWNPPAQVTTLFPNQTIVVTGANSGLGFEAAVKYVELGASAVILAVRTVSKGDTAKSIIEARTGKTGILHVWQLDMNSFDSVRAFAVRAEKELPNLNVVLLNAGVQASRYQESPEGWEETLQVNVLSTILLGILLLPRLKASKNLDGSLPHLDIVASGTARYITEDTLKDADASGGMLQKFNKPEHFQWRQQYALSKFIVMYAMVELAQHALNEQTGDVEVVVNACRPGATRSDLAREMAKSFVMKQIVVPMFFAMVARTTEQGTRTLVSATALGADSHGKFWENDKLLEPISFGDKENVKKVQSEVWAEIMDAVKETI